MPEGRSQSTEREAIHARSPQTTVTSSVVVQIPDQLQSSIPTCADDCFASYVAQFWNCPSNNASCLCSEYSTDGYTVGEIAFICTSVDCQSAIKSQEVEAYGACDSDPYAVPATHSTLTVPANILKALPTTAGSLAAASETSSPGTPSGQSTISASVATTSVDASGSGSPASPSTSHTTTQSHSPTAVATDGKSQTTKSSFTPAQAVGVSVGVLGAVIAAAGLFFLYWCMKRRKARQKPNRRHSNDFVGTDNPNPKPFKRRPTDPAIPAHTFGAPVAEETSNLRNGLWVSQEPGNNVYNSVRSQPYQYRYNYENRVKGPTSPQSCRSESSTRTTSQLLPEKPSGMHSPHQQHSRAADFYATRDAFGGQRANRMPGARSPGIGLPAHPGVWRNRYPQYTEQYTLSPEPLPTRSSSLAMPHHAPVDTRGGFPRPPPAVARQYGEAERGSGQMRSRDSNNSVLNYYASPECASPDELRVVTPIEEGAQTRRPPPMAITVTKPSHPPQAIRLSRASDTSHRTSFESTDPDEPTPPEEDEKQLTPVAELESPISAIRYPKVPRSSNQLIPRSPQYQGSPRQGTNAWGQKEAMHRKVSPREPEAPQRQDGSQHTPTLSGSTLAAKRRGDNAALHLEKGLYIVNPSYHQSPDRQFNVPPRGKQRLGRQESPLKGHDRGANSPRDDQWVLPVNEQHSMDPGLQSPSWEPKLTPRKEGDELYLSVSAATPRAVRFEMMN